MRCTPDEVGRRLQAGGLARLAGEAPAIAAHWQVLVAMAAPFDARPLTDGEGEDDGAQGA